MDLNGEYRIAAPRDVVWAALNDPDVLRQCIPGCETLEQKSPTEMAARVRLKIGPVSAAFNGAVTLSNISAPESYTIAGQGQGGAAGFAKGHADVRLAEDGPEATVLSYAARADVGGKLATLGGRLITATSQKLADEFFGNFVKVVSGEDAADAGAAGGEKKKGFWKRWLGKS
ncbi:MAG TPA: carbon monoxide dehydrogenase subunit G [Hyphomicrobiaceae bacterium]|nr:carbon monoxide dehydrogenase subunit G [Hyphomicrobiaceae bacterium]